MTDPPATSSLNATLNTLASGFRLLHVHGHSDLAAGFLVARHPTTPNKFLTHSHGRHWDEIQPHDFFSVDTATKQALGAANLGAVQLGSAVFEACPRCNALIHSHPRGVMGLAASGDGLRALFEPSFLFWNRTAYIRGDYFFGDAYCDEVASLFAAGAVAVVLRNHALLVAGGTVQEAFLRAYMFEQAASLQLATPALAPALSHAEEEYHASSHYGWPGGYTGALEWPGLLRRLDRLTASGAMPPLERLPEDDAVAVDGAVVSSSSSSTTTTTSFSSEACYADDVTEEPTISAVPLADAPFGAAVRGVRIGALSAQTASAVLAALYRHKLLLFRTVTRGDEEGAEVAYQRRESFRAFAASLGRLKEVFGSGISYPALDEHAGVHAIEFNSTRPPHLDIWHADHSWTSMPSDVEMLMADEVPPPEAGGDTIWADATAAYEALSPRLQELVRSVRCTHSLGGGKGYADDRGATDEEREQLRRDHPAVQHPCAPRHPVTGQRLLYVSDSFAAGIDGLTATETAAIEPMLCAAAGPDNSAQYRHSWRAGDVVVYDNLALQHFAVADYFPHVRRMLHASREGTRPFRE